jgi:hypothetical protein
MNRRRILSGVHRSIARQQGINAAAWFAGQSFTSASRGDMPLERLSDKQLNEAGAGLLPTRIVCPDCYGTREVQQQITDNLTVTASCAECGGCGYLEVK